MYLEPKLNDGLPCFLRCVGELGQVWLMKVDQDLTFMNLIKSRSMPE